MSKLVDKERLAKLAAALDARAKAAVKKEEERAMAAEQAVDAKADANIAAIAAINNETTGLLKQAKDHAQGLVDGEKDAREEKEGVFESRIGAIEATLEGTVDKFFGEFKDSATLADMVKNIADNEEAIAKLNGGEEEEGSVAKAVKDAKDAQNVFNVDFEARIKANEAFVAAQPGVDSAQNVRIKALEDDAPVKQAAIEAAQGAADAAQAAAEAADAKAVAAQNDVDALEPVVAKLDGADTVEGSVKKQIKDAVAAVEESLQGEFAAADNALKAALQKEIDDDIAAERLLRVAEEQRIEKECDDAMAQEVIDRNAAIDVEKQRALGQEAAIRGELADEAAEIRGEMAEQHAAMNKALEDEAAAIRGEFAAADVQVLADAKKYANEEITKLVDSAPDAMNTLNELAKAIKDNKDVYDGYVAEHATAMAAMKTELQAEIDADVKVVSDELAKQKDAAQDGTLANKIAAEVAKAREEEGKLNQAIVDEAAAARAAEQALGGRIDGVVEVNNAQNTKIAALEALVGVGGEEGKKNAVEELQDAVAENAAAIATNAAAAKKAQDEVDAVEGRMDSAEEAIKALQDANKDGGAVAEAIEAAQGAANAAQAAADALKGRLDNEGGLVDRLEAAEAFVEGHSHADIEQGIADNAADIVELQTFMNAHSHEAMEKGIADNKADIEKEVKDRNAAIAKALEVYSTTEEMTTVIGNVVNSLSLTIENDKVVLKLGGADGIELTSVDLDLVTDADINAMIDALDAE